MNRILLAFLMVLLAITTFERAYSSTYKSPMLPNHINEKTLKRRQSSSQRHLPILRRQRRQLGGILPGVGGAVGGITGALPGIINDTGIGGAVGSIGTGAGNALGSIGSGLGSALSNLRVDLSLNASIENISISIGKLDLALDVHVRTGGPGSNQSLNAPATL